MSLRPGEEIGMEVHQETQFFRVESGTGTVITVGPRGGVKRTRITDGSAIVIPGGTRHNVKNSGTVPLKVYTIYAPSHHPPRTHQKVKPSS